MKLQNNSRYLLTVWFMWTVLLVPAITAQTSATAEQLKKQLNELKAKETLSEAWSPESKEAYKKSLAVLTTAHEKAAAEAAAANEIQQIKDLLKLITEPEARKPLEEQLSKLTTANQPAAKTAIKAEGAATTQSNGEDEDENESKPAIICGRLRLAWLDQLLALVAQLPGPAAAMKENGGKEDSELGKIIRAVFKGSRFKGETSCESEVAKTQLTDQGIGQKDAAILLLKAALEAVDGSKGENVTTFKFTGNDRQELQKGIKTLFAEAHISKETLQRQIELLSGYLGNVTVYVKNNDGLAATAVTDENGNYKTSVPGGVYSVSTEADNEHSKRTIKVADNESIKVNLAIEDRPVSLLARAVVGYQQAGAAATSFEQNYFFDLFVSQSLPFKQKINPDFGERTRIWGAIRSISVPQSDNVKVGDLVLNLGQKVGDLKANEAARVFDYLGGVEVRIRGLNSTALLPSFDRDTKQKFSLSFIAGFGFVTPTDATAGDSLRTFRLNDAGRRELRKRFPQFDPVNKNKLGADFIDLSARDFVSFSPMDRDRFFRQYYAGFRMQTFFFNRHNVPMQRFPVQLDLSYGINEYVTGGRARGGVFRLDGYFPLPYDGLKFINLFGTAVLRPVRARIEQPLLLEPFTAGTGETLNAAIYGSKGVIVPVSQFNRDYYRVGIGIDFLAFVQQLKTWAKPAAKAAATTTEKKE